MVLYIVLYLAFCAMALGVNSRRQEPWLALTMVFLFLFMGWRDHVGCDFTGYLNRFEAISPYSTLGEAFTAEEGGFELLITMVRINGLDYHWLNVFASAIIAAGHYHFARHFPRPMAVIACLFPVIILQLSMSGIRQGIAVALLLVATVSFLKGRKLATALWIVAAAEFHTSALIFLPAALLAGTAVSTLRLTLAIAVLTPLSMVLMGDQLADYSDQYIDQIYGTSSSDGAIYRYVLVLIPFAWFLFRMPAMRALYPAEFEFFKLNAIFALSLAPVFAISSLIVHRLTFYIMPISVLLLTYLHASIADRDGRMLVRLLPFALYGAYLVAWALTSRHASLCYNPYRSYLLS